IIYSISTYELFLLFSRTLTGIGDSTIWVSTVLILNQWFNRKEFTRLIGIAGMTGSLGFLLATAPSTAIIILVGWRATFFSVGLLLFLCGILLYIVLIKKPEQAIFIKNDIQREKLLISLRKLFLKR